MNKCFNKKQQSSIADGVVKDTFALNIKNRIMELKSLKFDRLYAYSQVLLACSLQGEIESSQNSSCKILELKSQNHCLFKIVSSGELNNCFSERNINDNSRAAQTRIQTQSSLLKEHLSILFKLRKIAFELDNDEQRYILINLELCQEMMLKKKYQKGKKYLDSAFSYFLVLYKKSRFRMMQVPSFYENSNSATHFQNYVQYIQAILTSRFSAEQLMEESSSLTRYRNCTFPRFSQQQFFKQITQATQISQIPFISSRPTIQPIIEDYMESIEDNANRQQHQIQNFVSFDKIQSNQTNGGQKNIRISKRSCSLTPFAPNHPIILKEYLISQKNFQIQNTNESNKEKKVPNKEDNVTKKKNIRDFKVSSNSPTNGVECLPQTFSINPTPTEYFATSSEGSISSQRSEMLSPPDELTQQFSTHQNVVIQADKLQPQEEILNMIDKGRIQSTSFTSWPQKTSFSMPLDILFSKIQIYEAVLEIKIGNQFKGCLLLTESIENSPRYLPSDRLLSLQILECVMKNFQEEKACITKHIMKFNNTKLNISVILNCTTNLKDICKQLYEVHSLCNIFGLVVVNERVEQFVTPRNQQSFIGEKNFIENTFKYLQNKVISQQMYHFHQALVKGSAQFHQERKQNDGNQIKNFLLIIESTDCTLKQEHFDHNIFTELNQQKVKVLVYLPSYDKQQFTLNISRLDLPFKIRFFYLFQHLIDYLCRKSFKFCTTEPILIEKV